MPTIQVTGQLVDPTTGVEGGAEIIITSLINYGNTTKKSSKKVLTDSVGNYDFPLVEGKHMFRVKYSNEYTFTNIGTAIVSDELPSVIDLISLLESSVTNPEPGLVSKLQQIAVEAAASAQNASEAAARAEAAASTSENGQEGTITLDYTDVGALGATENAVSASKWQTARTLTIDGDASGDVSLDGSSNTTLTIAVANDSHTHDGRYYTEAESDDRFANLAGDTFTGDVAISKASGRLSFNETDHENNNSGINWVTSGENLELIHENNESDINTVGGNEQALILRSDSGASQAGLEVEGEIFAKGNQRVFHHDYHPNADKWTLARTITLSGDASGSVSINGARDVTLPVTITNTSSTSDRRLKKNIKLIDNALNKVGELNGYTYEKRSSLDSDEYIRETGVIAQEVEKVLPEAVTDSGDEDRILSVAYGNMNGLLIEAIKEERRKREALEERIARLETLLS